MPDKDEKAGAPQRSEMSADQVFVIRLWLERASDRHTAPLWRGRVTCVNTGTETHVDGLEAAFDAVRAAFAAGRPDPTDQPRH